MRLRYGGAFIGGKDFPLLEGAKISPPPERPLTVFEPKGEVAQDSASSVLTIDAEYADTAITNDLAKNLIRHDSDVETYGWRRRTVNVDLLSRSFLPGERVDVNSLKEKGLVPRDTAYIRVMARGIIDKPLCVYANEFTPAAVKMIALSGGKAVKVGTVKLRKNRGREK